MRKLGPPFASRRLQPSILQATCLPSVERGLTVRLWHRYSLEQTAQSPERFLADLFRRHCDHRNQASDRQMKTVSAVLAPETADHRREP